MVGAKICGQQVISSGPTLQIWRAATDNDGIKGWTGQDKKALGRWITTGVSSSTIRPLSFSHSLTEDGSIVVISEHAAACGISEDAVRHKQTFTFRTDGTVLVDNLFIVDPLFQDLPRLGVRLTLAAGFENLNWFGRGPFENYSDRKRAAMVGLHAGTVADQYVPYILPQEHGNHTDVRWLSLDNAVSCLNIRALGQLEFSANHYSAEDLFAAYHTTDLHPRSETILNLDFRQRGLGTASCGPDVGPTHIIPSGQHSWSYLLALSPTTHNPNH